MKHTLHIFGKDVRHFWKEIAISWLLLAEYGRECSRRLDFFAVGVGSLVASTLFLGFLVIVGWWFLMMRVVHDESLVGDRQFWVTRPYE